MGAKLELAVTDNAENWGSTGQTIDAHRLTHAWAELGATWNCADDTDTSNLLPDCPNDAWEMNTLFPESNPWTAAPSDTLLVTNGTSGTVQLDMTDDVAAFLSGASNFGWIVKKTDETASGHITFGSKENAAVPHLVVMYRKP